MKSDVFITTGSHLYEQKSKSNEEPVQCSNKSIYNIEKANNIQLISGGNMDLSGDIAVSDLKVAPKTSIGSKDFDSDDEFEKK